MEGSCHSIKLMLNVAVALVLAFVIICSTILSIAFNQIYWSPVGGFMILVAGTSNQFYWPLVHGFMILIVGTYLCLRFSSARFYFQPNALIHRLFLCSYLLIGLANVIWQSAFNRANEGLQSVMFLPLLILTMIVIIGSGVTALAIGIISLFERSESIK